MLIESPSSFMTSNLTIAIETETSPNDISPQTDEQQEQITEKKLPDEQPNGFLFHKFI